MTAWLIVGSAGQLGQDLQRVLAPTSAEVTALDLPDIDITNPTSVAAALTTYRPDYVVNAAAYTAVDAAEEDEATAQRVNAVGPAVLAQACADRQDTWLVQVSTDYVFSGERSTPYPEDAEPNPQSAYGRTKLAGELAVRELLPDRSYIVRTAWLYSEHGGNFVKTMLRLEQAHSTVAVVSDQLGQPTWSWDLANQIVTLVASHAPAGVYHGTSSGQTTWHGFTQEIYRLLGEDPTRVNATTTDQFPRPAPRPANSVLGHAGWERIAVAPIRPWDEALAEALPRIVAAGVGQESDT
ncbi:MAG: dTDP-4-dehydrorhamnose reductase [Actinomycetia bacterium]|nr:dTDP-4-dehydrorhamnose reductase [Actinomycetes bacterium]